MDMPPRSSRGFQLTIWVTCLIVVSAAVVAWSQRYLSSGSLGLRTVFPLFGLLAFSLMWTHYVSGALQRYLDYPGQVLDKYFTVTSSVVLVLILLHPGLFIVQLWLDGLGLPPASYLSVYTELASRIALVLGTLSLVAFLVFELRRKFKAASWWKYVELINILAMFAIFYHALRLGGVFSIEWYTNLWFGYGILLIISVSYNYLYDRKKRRTA
ncbi:hypothetical protein H7Y40_01655 [Pedobacter sp.]|nr:hypothetical protein [Candidatus Saccharibacteria bacterium]